MKDPTVAANRTDFLRYIIPIVVFGLSLLLAMAPQTAAAACGGATTVNNATQLNNAIAAFNAAASPCVFTIQLSADISLAASTTAINNPNSGVSLVIAGDGFTVNGNGVDGVRPLHVLANTTVTINDLTIRGGKMTGPGTAARGGGIRIEGGTVTINRSTVISNSVENRGGGLANQGGTVEINESTIMNNVATGTPTTPGVGGGIYNDGAMTIRNSTISGNDANGRASTEGGGVSNTGDLTLDSVTITDNGADLGAGLHFSTLTPSVLTIKNSIVGGNFPTNQDCYFETSGSTPATINDQGHNLVASQQGCGFVNGANGNIVGRDPKLNPLAGNGGPTLTHAPVLDSPVIDAGDTTLATDQRGQPRPSGQADDIGAFESTLCSDSAWLVSNAGELNTAIACYNAKTVAGSYTITLTRSIGLPASSTAINNATAGVSLIIAGGGFTVDAGQISGVRPFLIEANTTVTMNDLAISGGKVTGAETGGAILNRGNLTVNRGTVELSIAESNGAGVHNLGVLAINDSTISGNEIQGGGASVAGAGVYNQGSLSIKNSTISGNTSSDDGGGIATTGPLDLDSVTVASNTAAGANANAAGAGVYVGGAGALTTRNSILAANSGAEDCFSGSSSAPADGGHNLVQNPGNCGFVNGANGNVVGQDPLLGSLRNNGGPTRTHALLSGSPAIDAGDTTLPTDQRGKPRPFGAADDIGAFELSFCDLNAWTVNDEALLNAAIACFNAKTLAGSYPMTLTQDINLTAPTTAINNVSNGVNLVINGSGFTVNGGGIDGVRPFHVLANTTVQMNDLIVTGGKVSGVEQGGGIRVDGGTLTLNRSIVMSNTAEVRGGGISNQLGTVEINDSAVVDNIATGNTADSGSGGGVANDNGPMTIRNSTISGNVSGGATGAGGGLDSTDNLTLDSVTIANNRAASGAGLYFRTDFAVVLAIRNSLLGGNEASRDCYFETVAGGATIQDQGHNLVGGQQACGFVDGANGNIVGQDPKLGPLADNGNATLTHALLQGSPAIDAGDTDLTTDQRGRARPGRTADDIGAFEAQIGSITIVKDADPGDDTTFDFNMTGAGGYQANFTLQDPSAASHTESGLYAGAYSVAENLPAIWGLTGVACQSTLGGSTFDYTVQNGAGINLADGDNVTCTFTNAKLGSLTVVKNTTGGDGSFDFTSQALGNFSLTTVSGAAQRSFANLLPGTYTVSETVPAGWAQMNATCSDGSDPANISLTAGENLTCTFENVKLASLTVVATADKEDSSFPFVSQKLGDFTLTTVGGTAQKLFALLELGVYSVTSSTPDGWQLASATCSDGSDPATIDLAAGEDVTCTFSFMKTPTALEPEKEPNLRNTLFLPLLRQ